MLKLYLFNGTSEWDTVHAAGIIAETKEEAERLYREKERIRDNAFKIEEIPITEGVHIKVFGHDSVGIAARY